MRRKLDEVSATAPPYITDGIDANLQAAADQFHAIALSDTVIAAANGFFDKAQAGLDLLDNTDALAKQIAGNVSLVMTRLAKFPPNYYADLKDSLPGVFIIVDPTRGYNDPTNLVRPMLFAVDHGAAAIQLALDYAVVRASIPVTQPTPAQPPAPPSGVSTPSAAPAALAADAAPQAPPADVAQTAPANAATPTAPADVAPPAPATDATQTTPVDAAAPLAPATNATLRAPTSAAVAAFVNAAPAKPPADAAPRVPADAWPVTPADATPPTPLAGAAQTAPANSAAPPTSADAALAAPIPAVPPAPAAATPPTPANAAPAIPADAALHCDDLWKAARQRLLKRHCLLVELLGRLSWSALRAATLLIQEMREDTYEEDILDEISKQGQAEIFFDTQKARPLQPVFFSIKFNNSRFNNAAALQRLMCHWTFPDGLDEYTSKVCHYFSGYEHDTVPPSESGQAILAQAVTSSMTAGSNLQKGPPHKRPHYFLLLVRRVLGRFYTPPIKRDLDIYASIRGQQVDEAL